jgi:hypothetical protein
LVVSSAIRQAMNDLFAINAVRIIQHKKAATASFRLSRRYQKIAQ